MKRVTITGNLTRDSEIKKAGEKEAIQFTVAVNEKKKDMPAIFFSCLNFRVDRTLLGMLRKGAKVAVAGELTVQNYRNKENESQTMIGIIVADVEILSYPKDN